MFEIEIHGTPVPQKQTRFTCRCGRGRCYDPSAKDKEHIRWKVKPFAPQIPICSAVELTITFILPIPKSVSKSQRQKMINREILPDKKPDEDNLAYLISNALKELVYDDDRRVCAKHVYKFYGVEPKTIIKVSPILSKQSDGNDDADNI